jgi:nitrogen-specific signal transduction histidine kinase
MGVFAERVKAEFNTIFTAILEYAEMAYTVSSQSAATQRYIGQVLDAGHRARSLIEQRLDHAERLQSVGVLAGGIAHEFNNILGAILGYAEMAHAASDGSVAAQRHIEQIIDASHRARLIIEQVLAMSRRQERVVHPINLAQVVEETRPLLDMMVPQTMELNVHITHRDSVIAGNPIEIQQILLNLCRNAADAVDGTGQIDIDVCQITLGQARALHSCQVPPGDYVRLSIRDNGSGIAADVLPHIFEPFYTTKARSGGTGLGLAAVLEHVTGLCGFIDVTSSAGAGTCFDIYVPRSNERSVDLSLFYPMKKTPLGHGEIIAIIEADAGVLEMHENRVAALGYEPIGFASLDALKTWMETRNEPDLIMVGAASFQTGAEIPGQYGMIAHVPLVIIGECEEAFLMAHHAQASLLKPTFSIEDLAHILRKQIS